MSDTATERDPYSQVIDCVWRILENSADFARLVKPANRVKMTGLDRAPLKEEFNEEDVPTVAVFSEGTTPNKTRSSDHLSDTMRLSINVGSGDQRIDHRHFPIKWSVFRAMMAESVKCANFESLSWRGVPFVTGVTLGAATDRVAGEEVNKGIRGWVQVWAFEVDLSFGVVEILKG